MNFTREPIIETIIMPKEGYKLLLRSSKVAHREEYIVDAVEVISFGHSFFFRSLEKPKSVLLPVADYEIEEVRETRMALKSAPSPAEKSIKIGGGAAPRPARPEEEESEPSPGNEVSPAGGGSKRNRRRHRRRQHQQQSGQPHQGAPVAREDDVEGNRDEHTPATALPIPPMPHLIPPPTTLISETMSRYKELKGDEPPTVIKDNEE